MNIFLNDKHQKKGVTEATIVMIIVVVLMFLSGMVYLDPPPETGIAVNFGTSDVGSGSVQPQQNAQPKPVQQEPEKVQESKPKVQENVLTQDNEDAPVIKETKKPKKDKPKKDKPKKDPKPKHDKSVLDILNNVKNAPGADTNNSSGEGNDNQAGDKGSRNGDPNASGYYGNGGKNGSSGTGNYRLGNRKALSKPKPSYKCNEEGKVVIKIYVNKAGKVINAKVGKGTSNPAPCLVNAAKQAALNTKWEKDSKATDPQIGQIIFYFKTRE